MPYSISIDTGGAAFEDPGPELARILRKLADGLDRGGITPPEDAHLYDVNGNRAGIAHQVEREPGTESATLDALAAWLTYPTDDEQWRSAADFIEYAALLIGATGRSTDPAPWTDEDERADAERAATLVARAVEGPPARSASTVAEMENGWTP